MKNEMLQKILTSVNQHIKYVSLTEENMDEDLEKLGMESLEFISMILDLEKTFSVEIPDEYLVLSEINTVRKIADVIVQMKKIDRMEER